MEGQSFREELMPVAESIQRNVKDGFGVALIAFMKPVGDTGEIEMTFVSPMEPEHVGAICKRILDSLGLGYEVSRQIVVPKAMGGGTYRV